MFCPKCGSTLTVNDSGTFECPRGLEFSADLSQRLRDHYPDCRSVTGFVVELDGNRRWFCPGCGDDLDGLNGNCARCGVAMSLVMIHSLIELHPHPDGRGGWF